MSVWPGSVLTVALLFDIVASNPHHSRRVGTFDAPSPYTVDLTISPDASFVNRIGPAHHALFTTSDNSSSNDIPLYKLLRTYGMFVRAGDRPVILTVDTSTADTWIADPYFNCLDVMGSFHSQSYCQMGPTVSPKRDCGTERIADAHLNIQYADYNGVSGPMAVIPLGLTPSLTIDQLVGIANNVLTVYGWDNVTSGVLGLAYSTLSNMYSGTDAMKIDECLLETALNSSDGRISQSVKDSCGRQMYSSLSETLFSSNTTSDWNSTTTMRHKKFSLAMSRSREGDLGGGSITFGGVPDTTSPYVNASDPFVVVPNQPLKNDSSSQLSYYVLPVEGITLPLDPGSIPANASNDTSHYQRRLHRSNAQSTTSQLTTILHPSQFIIDSTSAFSFFPKGLSASYNALFTPPAKRYYHRGSWLLNCSRLTNIPSLGINIAGETFWHNPADLVVRTTQLSYDPLSQEYKTVEICYSAIQDAVSDGHQFGYDSRVRGAKTQRQEKAKRTQRGGEGDGALVLGQPFLKNVLAVFDVGNSEISLMSRVEYLS